MSFVKNKFKHHYTLHFLIIVVKSQKTFWNILNNVTCIGNLLYVPRQFHGIETNRVVYLVASYRF